jgi:hypothetical protein
MSKVEHYYLLGGNQTKSDKESQDSEVQSTKGGANDGGGLEEKIGAHLHTHIHTPPSFIMR